MNNKTYINCSIISVHKYEKRLKLFENIKEYSIVIIVFNKKYKINVGTLLLISRSVIVNYAVYNTFKLYNNYLIAHVKKNECSGNNLSINKLRVPFRSWIVDIIIGITIIVFDTLVSNMRELLQ